VITVEVVDDAGLNEAVMPVGRPDAAKATLPVKGLMSATVMVTVQLALWSMLQEVAEGLSVKPPVPVEVTVSVKVVVTGVSDPEVPVTVMA
jgi:hypothetical protein